MLFRDRREAGRRLAERMLDHGYADRSDLVVLALPRGGVPVAYKVAEALNAPLDVFVVRKLGMPGNEEFAMGAVASGGISVRRPLLIEAYRIPERVVDGIAAKERIELARRERAYRQNRPPLDVHGRTVILVDDGLATGSSMHAAILALREARPAGIVVAVPVASVEATEAMRIAADEAICLATPESFESVGQWYGNFTQTTDEEVSELLSRARSRGAGGERYARGA